ncbi:hypothetical protein O7543_01190 [Solwaraspora sp. WMMA2080]|uniref:hypothetical protein n=1 Tax=unclassified Solwaraspora TaxID=2627926 RepID=UPI00248B57EF|nr:MULTISPECIES: hypothetical protein [unclassified Solwaraspora]WBB94967.1 hypothetical protein O7553_16185 [Solwaraspora sp. WMMA2059]WBC21150.1 hypothetical protein O7543_01190 [Solwaraspora sp. WMMA2080]
MIVASLVLILVAVTLLVLGLASGSSLLLVGSIVASLLAAVALVVGARQAAAARAGDGRVGSVDPEPLSRPEFGVDSDPVQGAGQWSSAAPVGRQPTDPADDHLGGGAADDGPPDEPAVEETGETDHARLAGLDAEVIVVDGRPRYHLASCLYLVARDGEPLPVREALELGFTPCGLCQPNRTLLAESGRV